MDLLILIVLGTLALSLAIAFALMKRSRPALGVLIGAVPIALMVFLIDRSLDASIQRCLDFACESAGLPPGCSRVELGCGEWTGLGYALLYLGGIADIILYVLGVIVIALVRRVRRSEVPPHGPPIGPGP